MMKRTLAFALALALACDSPSDTGGDAIDVRGVWSYTAAQESPTLTIRGSIRVDLQTGREFSGTAEFNETDVQGTQINRSGQLSGRVVGTSAVDFDIFFDNTARRHVAAIANDSLHGTWARTGVVPPITGSFSAKRIQ